MAGSPRTRRPVDERRAQLLELGLRLFASRTYDEVAIDDIAAEAGVSKGLLYHYFGSKRAFYVAVVRETSARLLAEVEAVVAQESHLLQGDALRAYLRFAKERRASYLALTRSGVGNDAEVTAILEETRRRLTTRVLELAGLAASGPLYRLAARSWIGQVEATCLAWLEGPEDEVSEDDVVELLRASLVATFLEAKARTAARGTGPPTR